MLLEGACAIHITNVGIHRFLQDREMLPRQKRHQFHSIKSTFLESISLILPRPRPIQVLYDQVVELALLNRTGSRASFERLPIRAIRIIFINHIMSIIGITANPIGQSYSTGEIAKREASVYFVSGGMPKRQAVIVFVVCCI
jgi:hypothetical protein